MSNKKTTGFVAGAAGIALLMGGATFALWSASDDIDGGTITAGNLDVDVLEDQVTWTDRSGGGNAPIDDLGAFRIVPGDTIQGRFPIDVALEGNNLAANLSFFYDDEQMRESDLFKGLTEPEFSVEVNQRHLDLAFGPDGVTVVNLVPKGNDVPTGGIEVDKKIDGKPDLTAVVSMKFPETTNDQDFAKTKLALAKAGVTLEQVRR